MSPRGGAHGDDDPWPRFEAPPSLEIDLGERLGSEGLGRRELGRGRELAWWGVNWWGRERESDLNVVGLKTVDIGSTGQTGWLHRSDRSGPNWQEKFWFGGLSCELALMTLINLIMAISTWGVTILPPKKNLVPRFNEDAKLQETWKVRYLGTFVTTPDIGI